MTMRTRRFAAWLAALAMALQALWPLLVQAKPRGVVVVPVCSVDGETHYAEVQTGNSRDAYSKHCPQCWLGSDRALPTTCEPAAQPSAHSTAVAPADDAPLAPSVSLTTPPPRAPPLLP